MSLVVRIEQEEDRQGVWEVNERAFGRPDEANLVNKLRAANALTLSLVGMLDGRVVGHVLFSPVVLEIDGGKTAEGVGLGPVAVLPEYQNQSVGSQLIQQGIQQCRQADCAFMVVLGHAAYYPRFGFRPAIEFGIRSEFDVPPELFMVMELKERALQNKPGLIKYQPEFAS